MALKTSRRHERRIEKVREATRELAKGRLAKAAFLFSSEFYRYVPPDDIADTDPQVLAAIAMSILEFGRVRAPDSLLIRAFNPTAAEHGWNSPYSIVEIVTDDMSFLVDSVVNELARQGISVNRIVHPVLKVRRTRDGTISRLHSSGASDTVAIAESFIYVELNQQGDEEILQRVVSGLTAVLGHVRSAVEDWAKMRARVASVLAELDANPPPIKPGELNESKHFLRWLDDGHFTFIGCREYKFARRKGVTRPEIIPGSGLGILRGDDRTVFESLNSGTALPPEVAAFIDNPRLLLIGKSPQRAPVHRNVYVDRIGVKQYNRRGDVIGEKLFWGCLPPRPIIAARPTFRYCDERSLTSSRPRDCRPIATTERLCCMSWRRFRATSCFRFPTQNCWRSRRGLCICRNGTVRRCFCGEIPLNDSLPVWCIFPVSVTVATCARRYRVFWKRHLPGNVACSTRSWICIPC